MANDTNPSRAAEPGSEPVRTQVFTIPAMTLTTEQVEYLRNLRDKETKYDPTTVIGGTKVQTRS